MSIADWATSPDGSVSTFPLACAEIQSASLGKVTAIAFGEPRSRTPANIVATLCRNFCIDAPRLTPHGDEITHGVMVSTYRTPKKVPENKGFVIVRCQSAVSHARFTPESGHVRCN